MNTYTDWNRMWDSNKVGTFYVASYPKGLGGGKSHPNVYTTFKTLEAAQEFFNAAIVDLMTNKHPRAKYMASVQLLKIEKDVRVMGSVRRKSPVPIHQWSEARNTNFSWPTGPTHYLDNRVVRKSLYFSANQYKKVAGL